MSTDTKRSDCLKLKDKYSVRWKNNHFDLLYDWMFRWWIKNETKSQQASPATEVHLSERKQCNIYISEIKVGTTDTTTFIWHTALICTQWCTRSVTIKTEYIVTTHVNFIHTRCPSRTHVDTAINQHSLIKNKLCTC